MKKIWYYCTIYLDFFVIGGTAVKLSLIRRADAVLLALAILAAALWWGFTRSSGAVGAAVVVQTPTGSATYPLDKPAAFSLTGNGGIVLQVEIKDGGVRVSHSTCPDKVCVNGGTLSRGGQSAVCVPAGITLRVIGGNDGVDGVTA